MAYDEAVAERIRGALGRRRGITERKMFGGIAFMLHGNMCVGVVDDRIVLRLGEERATAALQRTHTKPMDFTGKPMKTMVYVEPAGYRTAKQLRGWIDVAIAFGKTLPRKDP